MAPSTAAQEVRGCMREGGLVAFSGRHEPTTESAPGRPCRSLYCAFSFVSPLCPTVGHAAPEDTDRSPIQPTTQGTSGRLSLSISTVFSPLASPPSGRSPLPTNHTGHKRCFFLPLSPLATPPSGTTMDPRMPSAKDSTSMSALSDSTTCTGKNKGEGGLHKES